MSHLKRVLFVGVDSKVIADTREAIGADVQFSTLTRHETIPDELLEAINVVLIDSRSSEDLLEPVSRALQSNQVSSKVFAVGSAEIPTEIGKLFPSVRPMGFPLDYAYLRGVLDSAHQDRARIITMDEEQGRIRCLYEISSSLLKIGSRDQISQALEHSLPGLFDASLILLVFPSDNHPLIFIHATRPLTPRLLAALRNHLREAWDVLRSDRKVAWEWIDALAHEDDNDADLALIPSSFMTTPISIAKRTEGFLTLLPRQQERLEEIFLQSFFMVGDLISVLLHNIDLRERLEERAMHDGLTRLLNRQTVLELLERECRRSQRYGTEVSVVMFDIDHFKQVNDRYGHLAGDEALRFVAERLRMSVREMDLTGRCGGEEFLCVLVNTSLNGATIWAERFRAMLASEKVHFADIEFNLTASFGVATAAGEYAEINDLLARSDAVLYQAKREGRNRVCASSPIEKMSSAGVVETGMQSDTPVVR